MSGICPAVQNLRPPTLEERAGLDYRWPNGGRTVFVSRGWPGIVSRDLPGAVLEGANEITVCISSQYAITYTTAEAVRDQRFRRIVGGWPEAGRGMKVESLKEYRVPAP